MMAVLPDASSREAHSKNYLDTCARECKIFIDTCSLASPKIETFWDNICPYLKKYENKVFIPLRVLEELQKLASSETKEDAEQANASLKRLTQLQNAGYVEFRGEDTDNFTDNVFLVVFTKFRMQHKLLLITQDRKLARDIERLNESEAVSAKPVYARKINQYGFLSRIHADAETGAIPQPVQDKDVPAFCLCDSLTTVSDVPISVSRIPIGGEEVFTPQGPIHLVQELGSGKEGTVYTTDTPYVAKIYRNRELTERKRQKLQLMLQKKLNYPGICYPVDSIQNAKGEFVGYLMPRANGRELRTSVFIPHLQRCFPHWRKRDLVELCVTILEKLQYLHSHNIILGDINPANILVASPREVYFVDVDSYQVEGFPCPVGTPNFTAPEIQRRHFPDFLRTMDQENFAVATLLFMIMLPGKTPYAQQGGEDFIKNIIKMDFSYPFGENSNGKVPDGPWRFMWSHLTYAIKEAFYHTFRHDGKYAQVGKRLSSAEWLTLFKTYLELLDSGKLGEQDKMSEEIRPTRFKKNPNIKYVVCRCCGKEVESFRVSDGICGECQKNSAWGSRICSDCGEGFVITNGEFEFYMSKGLDLPVRCKDCRERRKQERAATYGTPVESVPRTRKAQPSQSSSGSHSSTGTSSGSFCFITTAVCEYFGKDDDCEELTALRHYRDTWLSKQPGGQELIDEYYATAPSIVSRLKASPRYAQYCECLWAEYLRPCLDMIAQGEFVKCRDRYVQMVRYMQSELN